MEECDGDVLVLPQFAPWKGEAIGSSYKFVVYPSSRGGYVVRRAYQLVLMIRHLYVPFQKNGVERPQKNLLKLQV